MITTPARRGRRVLLRRFRRITDVQVYACRKVAGSSSWSQHAWGNALDVFATKAELGQIARYLVRHARRRRVQTVIFDGRSWSWDHRRWVPYTGSNPHTSHVHVDFRPRRFGTPPCAGG